MKIRGLHLLAPWFLRQCKPLHLVWDSTYKSRGFAWSARIGSTIRANFCILCRFQRIKRGGLRGGRFSCKDQRGLYETIMQTPRFLTAALTFPQDSAARSLSASCKPSSFLRAEQGKCKPLRLVQDLVQKTRDFACSGVSDFRVLRSSGGYSIKPLLVAFLGHGFATNLQVVALFQRHFQQTRRLPQFLVLFEVENCCDRRVCRNEAQRSAANVCVAAGCRRPARSSAWKCHKTRPLRNGPLLAAQWPPALAWSGRLKSGRNGVRCTLGAARPLWRACRRREK